MSDRNNFKEFESTINSFRRKFEEISVDFAKYLHRDRSVYGLYGLLDAPSAAYGLIKTTYAVLLNDRDATGFSSFFRSPIGIVISATTVFVLGIASFLGNYIDDAEKDAFIKYNIQFGNAPEILSDYAKNTLYVLNIDSKILQVKALYKDKLYEFDLERAWLGEHADKVFQQALLTDCECTDADVLTAIRNATSVRSTSTILGYWCATYWPFFRDVIKGFKNIFKGMCAVQVLIELFFKQLISLWFVTAAGTLLLSFVRIALRDMRNKRKEDMDVNGALLSRIRQILVIPETRTEYQANASVKPVIGNNVQSLERAKEDLEKIKDELASKENGIDARERLFVDWRWNLIAATSGLLDSLYLFYGILFVSSAVLSLYSWIVFFPIIYTVVCMMVRSAQESEFQYLWQMTKIRIQLEVLRCEILISIQDFQECDVAFTSDGKVDESISDKSVVPQDKQNPLYWEKRQQELVNKLVNFAKLSEDLYNLNIENVHYGHYRALMAQLLDDLFVYGGILSIVLMVTLFVSLSGGVIPASVVCAFTILGAVILASSAYPFLVYNFKHTLIPIVSQFLLFFKERLNRPLSLIKDYSVKLRDIEWEWTITLPMNLISLLNGELIEKVAKSFYFTGRVSEAAGATATVELDNLPEIKPEIKSDIKPDIQLNSKLANSVENLVKINSIFVSQDGKSLIPKEGQLSLYLDKDEVWVVYLDTRNKSDDGERLEEKVNTVVRVNIESRLGSDSKKIRDCIRKKLDLTDVLRAQVYSALSESIVSKLSYSELLAKVKGDFDKSATNVKAIDSAPKFTEEAVRNIKDCSDQINLLNLTLLIAMAAKPASSEVVQGVAEIVRAGGSGVRQGEKITETVGLFFHPSKTPRLQEMSKVEISCVFGISFLYGLVLALRAHARSWGKDKPGASSGDLTGTRESSNVPNTSSMDNLFNCCIKDPGNCVINIGGSDSSTLGSSSVNFKPAF